VIVDGRDLPALYYAVAAHVRERHIAGRRVDPEVERVLHRLDSAIRLSRTRHESSCLTDDEASSETDERISSPQAAQILAWSIRKVQRHARELGGSDRTGRWLFRKSDVINYAERIASGEPAS
jgi:hypothetical protein